MGKNNLTGAWGEAVAADYLRKKHYKIEAARYYSRFGEIDLIAKKGGYLCFVEVKLRKDDSFAQAREFVDRKKMLKLRNTAELYLAQNPTDLQPRFDVAEVYAPDGVQTKHPKINYLENAFQ